MVLIYFYNYIDKEPITYINIDNINMSLGEVCALISGLILRNHKGEQIKLIKFIPQEPYKYYNKENIYWNPNTTIKEYMAFYKMIGERKCDLLYTII